MKTLDRHIQAQQQKLTPDANPDQLRRVLYGPLSAYWQGSLDIAARKDDGGEVELFGPDVEGDGDLFFDDLIRENYAILGDWAPGELHRAMQQAVPLPFHITGATEVTERQVMRGREMESTYPAEYDIDLAVDHIGGLSSTDNSAVAHFKATDVHII